MSISVVMGTCTFRRRGVLIVYLIVKVYITFATADECSCSRRVVLHEHDESGVLKKWVSKVGRSPGAAAKVIA